MIMLNARKSRLTNSLILWFNACNNFPCFIIVIQDILLASFVLKLPVNVPHMKALTRIFSFQAQQGRIACLYFPIVSILLENVKRLSWPPAPASISSSQRRLDPRASSRARSGRYMATFIVIYVCMYFYVVHPSPSHWH